MSDELQKKLLDYLDVLESRVKSAEDFASEQLPDVIQQWLAWEFWSCSLWVVLSLLFVAITVAVFLFVWRFAADCDDPEILRLGATILSCVGVIVFGITFCINLERAVKVSVAPKVVILEKLVDMVKTEGRR